MPDPDRLEELRKQRAKLDAELARLESEARRPAPPTDELFQKFAADEKSPAPSKSGCWTVFIIVMLIGVAVVAIGLLLIYR